VKFLLALVALALNLIYLQPNAFATDLLTTAENVFFDPHDQTRMGIEVEFSNLSPLRTAKLISSKLGVPYTYVGVTESDGVIHLPVPGTRQVFEILSPTLGKILVKQESNTTDDDDSDFSQGVTELVTEPLQFSQLPALQFLLTSVKDEGARGTTKTLAVATQINTEIGEGKRENIKAQVIVDILRSYVRKEHRVQIEESLNVPKIRQQYLKSFSKGFLKKLLDSAYKPTERELYDDYMYRQSLEILGVRGSWTLPIEDAREKLLAQRDPIVPSVIKLNAIRISSVLMFLFPEDPLTKIIEKSEWAFPRPLIEFRERNTDFTIETAAKQVLGLKSAAEKYGYYDHDKFLSNISTLDTPSIQALRKKTLAAAASKDSKPVIFRYYLGDESELNRDDYTELNKSYAGTTVGFLPANKFGQTPVVIPGESVVFHRRHFHRFSVLGKYNPSLPNFNIQQALENKYVEYLFWNDYSPGAMSRTVLLADLIGETTNTDEILERMNKAFPQGWVLKGTWDLGSEKSIITDKTKVALELKKYSESDFDQYKKAVEEKHKDLKESTPEDLSYYLKKNKGYLGWKISRMLSDPYGSLVQERVDIDREFRVEVVAGKVISGSTVDRWKYIYQEQGRLDKYKAPTDKMVQEVEGFANDLVKHLDPALRGIPFGMDIAVLKNGLMTMIESNPGGNSGFLFEEGGIESAKALRKRMEEYPEMLRKGEVSEGLTATEQMQFLETHFAKWGVDKSKIYSGMSFLSDHIDDPDYEPVTLEPEKFQIRCPASLASIGKRKRK
jgi:hypothetical protein